MAKDCLYIIVDGSKVIFSEYGDSKPHLDGRLYDLLMEATHVNSMAVWTRNAKFVWALARVQSTFSGPQLVWDETPPPNIIKLAGMIAG